MDWLNSISLFIITWWPWLNFFNDTWVLQFLLVYTSYLIYFTVNVYFTLFYLFLNFFYVGLFLSLYNLELFTAFLWLTECVIIFVSILMLFYLKVHGNINKTNVIIYSLRYFGIFIGFILFILFYLLPSEYEYFLPIELNFNYLFDDYYEALSNNKQNDLFGLYISYYVLNSFEFICIGIILLIGSLVCVNLNKFNKSFKSNNYYNLLTLFDFFNDFIKFFFIRKQNLVDQSVHVSSTRPFKKKIVK